MSSCGQDSEYERIFTNLAQCRNELNWSSAGVAAEKLESLKKSKTESLVAIQAARKACKAVKADIQTTEDKLLAVKVCIQCIENGEGVEAKLFRQSLKMARLRELYTSKLKELACIAHKILSIQLGMARMSEICLERRARRRNLNGKIKRAANKRKISEKKLALLKSSLTSKRIQHQRVIDELQENELQHKQTAAAVTRLQNNLSCHRSTFALSFDSQTLEKIELEIERCNLFKKVPIGPIWKYVDFRQKSWAPAMSSFLSCMLPYYFVDNFEDFEHLNAIYAKVIGGNPKPMIMIRPFQDEVYDVSPYFVTPPKGTWNFMEMIEVAHPTVMNCLIDRLEIEQTLLVPTFRKAIQLLSNEELLTPNLCHILTKQGDQYSLRRPQVPSFPCDPDDPLFPHDSEDQFFPHYDLQIYTQRNIQEEIAIAVKDLENAKEMQCNALKALEKSQKEFDTTKLKVEEIEKKRDVVSYKIVDLKMDLSEYEFDLSCVSSDDLETTWQGECSKIRENKKLKNNVAKEITELRKQIIKSNQELWILNKAVDLNSKIKNLPLQNHKLNKMLKVLNIKKCQKEEHVIQLENNARMLTEHVEQQQTVTNMCYSIACQMGSHYKTKPRSPIKIMAEINVLEKTIQQRS